MVLPAVVPAVLVEGEQVADDQTPPDVAAPAAVVLAVRVVVATLRALAAPEAAPRAGAVPVLAIPGALAAVMIAAATRPEMRGSPATTAPGRDATTALGREATTAAPRVAMTDPPLAVMTNSALAVMTNSALAVTIGQLRVVMTDQPRVGTIATYRAGGGMDGRLRAGRTARRKKPGSPRCGMTRVTAVPRVGRARKRVAPAGTTEALPIGDPAATTGIRLSALLVGMTEDPLTADRVVTIGPRLGVMTGPGRVVTIGRGRDVTTALGRDVTTGPGPGGMTALGRVVTIGRGRVVTIGPGPGGTTALGRAGTTGPRRVVTTGPGRRVRLGVGGGRIAARVVAIVLRERSGSTGPAGMRTRPARAVTIRRSPQVSPAPSSTVRSRRSCARCRGASLTWSRSTWSPLVG